MQAEVGSTAPADTDREIAERIAYERIALVYKLTPLPAACSLVFVGIVAIVFWKAGVPAAWLAAWVLAKAVVLPLRATETRRFEASLLGQKQQELTALALRLTIQRLMLPIKWLVQFL